jgi:hypothetical protein
MRMGIGMNKREWFEAYMATKRGDITVKFQDTGIARAGFWIGLGIVIAAGVIHGQIDVSGWFK